MLNSETEVAFSKIIGKPEYFEPHTESSVRVMQF